MSVKLSTVRSGVQLLSALMKEADSVGRTDGKVSKRDISLLKDTYGDGGSLDTALDKVHRYAAAKTGKASPSITEVNRALADAMKAIAKADLDDSKALDTAEGRRLAQTWKAVVEFSSDYEGMSVDDLTNRAI
ncbi:MAG: hypothetical protein AB2A00_02790 [Myxococcota bacterium]